MNNYGRRKRSFSCGPKQHSAEVKILGLVMKRDFRVTAVVEHNPVEWSTFKLGHVAGDRGDDLDPEALRVLDH